jgi:hypothetical protein
VRFGKRLGSFLSVEQAGRFDANLSARWF